MSRSRNAGRHVNPVPLATSAWRSCSPSATMPKPGSDGVVLRSPTRRTRSGSGARSRALRRYPRSRSRWRVSSPDGTPAMVAIFGGSGCPLTMSSRDPSGIRMPAPRNIGCTPKSPSTSGIELRRPMPSTPSRGRRIRYGYRSSISSLASSASATSGVSSWSATTWGRRGWRTSRMPSSTSCGVFESTSRFQLMIASRVSVDRGSPRARSSPGDHHSPPTRTSATTMTATAITRIRDARALRSLIVRSSASAPHTAPSASRCGSNAASSAGGPTCGARTRLTTNSTSASTAMPASSRVTRAANPWAAPARTRTRSGPSRTGARWSRTTPWAR